MDSSSKNSVDWSRDQRNFLIAIGSVSLVLTAGLIWKHRARMRVYSKPSSIHHKALSASTSTFKSTTPSTPRHEALSPIFVGWVRNPEETAAKILPRILPPEANQAGMVPTLAQILKRGMTNPDKTPDLASQKEIDEIDFNRPIGFTILTSAEGKGIRYAIAASTKDSTRATQAIESYAIRQGATKEHSNALHIDVFKGARSGQYLAAKGKWVTFATDIAALEQSAPIFAQGIDAAAHQSHEIVAHAPKEWTSGYFVQWAERTWIDWARPQLRDATSGPAKDLFDDITRRFKSTWVGAQDLNIAIDVRNETMHLEANVNVSEGSPLAQFLSSFPTGQTSTLLEAPRDATRAVLLHVPTSWVDLIRKFVVTPAPGTDIPEDIRSKTENAFSQLASVLEGEALLAEAIEPPPTPATTTLLRFKVRDAESAQKTMRELAPLMFQGVPGAQANVIPLSLDGGGVGEAREFNLPAQPQQPAPPPLGFAWVVRNGYLFISSGLTPKVRITRFASQQPEYQLTNDLDAKSFIARIPSRAAVALMIAPLRAGTPLPMLMQIPPVAQAITFSIDTHSNHLALQGDVDLNLGVAVLQQLFAPQAAMGPGGSAPPSGSTQPGTNAPASPLGPMKFPGMAPQAPRPTANTPPKSVHSSTIQIPLPPRRPVE